MYRDDGDNPEFSLATATGGDEAATQQALDEAFTQANAPRPLRADPGMSLLQDSVLGMHPNGELI